jgi:hypothetical protein
MDSFHDYRQHWYWWGLSPMGVLVMMVGLIIVIMFPQDALWLPNLYFGK